MWSDESFSDGSFSRESWLFGQEQPTPDRNESGGSAKRARHQRELAARNQEIIMAVVGIVTSGALDQ